MGVHRTRAIVRQAGQRLLWLPFYFRSKMVFYTGWDPTIQLLASLAVIRPMVAGLKRLVDVYDKICIT